MRMVPSTSASPSSHLSWLTTPLTTVSWRPQGKAATHTSSPSRTTSLNLTGGRLTPSISMTARSIPGLTAATMAFTRPLRSGALT